MRIQTRLFTLMWIRNRIQILASPKKGLKNLKKYSNRLIFHTFWLDICKLTRIRIRFQIQLSLWSGSWSWFLSDADSDPDADPGYQNDADPQHRFNVPICSLIWPACLFWWVLRKRGSERRDRLPSFRRRRGGWPRPAAAAGASPSQAPPPQSRLHQPCRKQECVQHGRRNYKKKTNP